MGKDSKVIHVTSYKAFQEAINSPKPVIVDFSAEWCGPCKVIAPRYEQLAQLNPDIAFYKVDVDENYEVALQENIQAMPTFVLYQNGKRIADPVRGANISKIRALVETATAEVISLP